MSARAFTAALKIIAVTALAVLATFTGPSAAQDLNDPFEILGGYFEAAGGLDRLKAEQAQHFEGTISLGGMSGPIRAWTAKPGLSRMELELGPLNIMQGDNGEARWELDSNGKLQVTTKLDEATLNRDEVERLMADYEYADPGSDIFSVTYEGIADIKGSDCYAVRISNSINSDRHTYYISVDDFRLEKSVAIRGENSADTYYDDYRAVNGLAVAFYMREVHHMTGQTHEIEISRYESNPAIDPAIFDPPEQGARDFAFATGDAAEDISFEFIEGHLFIPVRVAGRENLWILDTGAGMSVISQAFADEMGLEIEGHLKGQGAGGPVDIGIATLPPFELKGISFNEQKVAVIDMAELIRRIGIEITGILGFDFLSRFVTRVDYARELISFYDPESFSYTGNGIVVDAHMKEGVFETHATLDADLSGTWLFDLGASSTHLDQAYAVREGYTRKKGVLRMAHGASNEYQTKTVKGDNLQIGGFTLDRPRLAFVPGGTNTVPSMDRIGILGNSVFRNFILYLDYANEQVILEQGDRFNRAWPEDGSGLNVGWTTGHGAVEVLYVSPDTPAERAGFKKGDIVKAIDGKAVTPATGVLDVRALLREAPGTNYDVKIDRAGRQKNLKLELADLYR